MKLPFFLSISRSSLCVLGLASLAGLLSGCALESTAPAGAPDPVQFSGRVTGGEVPIQGATITFYETASTGVATNGVYVPATPLTALETTVTDSNGDFSFASATPCASSSDYVYATSAGGNTGANAVNPNSLLMAAVGGCNSFGSGTFVVINELSTIAAAYALQGFTSVSGAYTTGSATSITGYSITSDVATITANNTLTAGQTVILSSFTTSTFLNGTYVVSSTGLSSTQFEIAINNANVSQTTESGTATGITVPVVSVTASTTNYATALGSTPSAAGLAHAFANAANLETVNTGAANASIPGYSTTIVPAAVINALGNSIESCVNSTGGTASSSASSGCSALFYYTTINTVAPTNTLSALLNIARNPTNNVQSICGLTPSLGAAFAPAVACGAGSPNDWSLAIVYPMLYGQTNTGTSCNATYNASTSTNGLCYPLDVALDIDDDVFIMNGTASTSTASNVVAISSSGAPLWASTLDTTDTNPIMIAADKLGNVFYTNNATSGTAERVVQFTTSGTSETAISGYSYLWGVAIDSSNHVWVSQSVSSGNRNLREFTRGGGSTYTSDVLGTTPESVGSTPFQIAIDPSLNLWLSDYNSSTAEAPTIYASGHSTAEFEASSASFAGNYGIAIDSSGNGWADSANSFYEIVPSPPGAAPTSAVATEAANSTYTPAGGTASLRYLSIDGNNTIWAADDNATLADSAVVGYTSGATSPAVFYLRPCIDATGTTCPTASSYGIYAAHHAAVDSTGSLWVPSDANGTVTQIIGAAAPSWPLLSVLKPGLMP